MEWNGSPFALITHWNIAVLWCLWHICSNIVVYQCAVLAWSVLFKFYRFELCAKVKTVMPNTNIWTLRLGCHTNTSNKFVHFSYTKLYSRNAPFVQFLCYPAELCKYPSEVAGFEKIALHFVLTRNLWKIPQDLLAVIVESIFYSRYNFILMETFIGSQIHID